MPYVLLVGYRREVAKVLEKENIPFAILSDKPLLRTPPEAGFSITHSFSSEPEILTDLDANFAKLGRKPSHVLACTEAAVFLAGRIRKHFNTRMFKEALVRRCSNKIEMKEFLRGKGIPMTPYLIGTGKESAATVVEKLSLPIVVKPTSTSGGRGQVVCKTETDLEKAIGKKLLYEKFVDASEGSVESFISNGKILFTNITEYYEKRVCNLVPASYSTEEKQAILALNQQVITALKINWGMTHLEFYRHPDGLLFGEIALRPPGGYIMNLIRKSYKFNPWQAFVDIELDRPCSFPDQNSKFSAAWIYHPGPGTVTSVSDPPNISSLVKHKIKTKIGAEVQTRAGSGEDIGYSILSSENLAALLSDLETMQAYKSVELSADS